MFQIPTTLDEYVRDSRDHVRALRRDFPNPADFDMHVRGTVEDSLKKQGLPGPVLVFVMRAIFGED